MIQGYYGQDRMPRVRATVQLPGIQPEAKTEIDFLISTGTAHTIIPKEIAHGLGWSQPETPTQDIAFRGLPVPCHRQWLTLNMTHDSGRSTSHTIHAGVAAVDEWPRDIPPVLGRDFLEGMQAIFSPPRGTVELHLPSDPDWKD